MRSIGAARHIVRLVRQAPSSVSPSSVYLDHHATTPLDERVLTAMLPVLRGGGANPSSPHASGRAAKKLVDTAREQIAALVGVRAGEVILTAGATEASNLAILGLVSPDGRDKLISTTIEHPSVLEPLRKLESSGWNVVRLPVDRDGRVARERLEAALDDRTAMVTISAANGEIGAIQELACLVDAAHAHGALFHTDATQAIATQDLDLPSIGVDLASISAHKIYGPQGVGALIARASARARLRPILHGGDQENGHRSGTTNVAGAVGFGAAAALLLTERESDASRLEHLRDEFRAVLERDLGATINGPDEFRLPGNLNVRIANVDADALIAACPDVDFSAGSACSAGAPGPSSILTAIGLSDQEAQESVRFGLGRGTTDDELRRAAAAVVGAARRLRSAKEAPMPA